MKEATISKVAWHRFGLPASILLLDRPGFWLVSALINYQAGFGFIVAQPGEEQEAEAIVHTIRHGERFRWHTLQHVGELMEYAKKMPEVRGFYHSFRHEPSGYKYNFASLDLVIPEE